MQLFLQGDVAQYFAGINALAEMLDVTIAERGLPVIVKNGQQLSVGFENNSAWITCQNRVQFFRGLGLLIENLKSKKSFSLQEVPVFDHLAASFDMSRNGALAIKAMERILCRMALMGYTQAMMYTEETYEIDGYPFFGYLRGKYTKEQLCHLDAFADALGIELVPCIQTLGHLERFLHWNASAQYRDTPDVLLAGNEKTYQLIDAMFASARACYRTNKIHVGMDEAMNLGLGGYLRDNGYEDGFSIMQKHVKRVCEIAEKYGFDPMMWSDMYFRCASKTHDYYENNITIPQNVVDAAPAEMQLVYWDYYHPDKEFYDRYIHEHQRFSAKTWFAGGMWTWLGPAIDYDVFFKTSLPGLASCVENGIRDVMITAWGDDGAETNVNTTLLGLQVYAEYAYKGEFNKEHVFSRFSFCTGGNAQALCRIAAFNKTELLSPESDLPNGAKFLLYQDPMVGLYDMDIADLGFAENYKHLEKEFAGYAQGDGEYQLLYRFYQHLAAVLKDKAELGLGLYRAYHARDKETLHVLAQQALAAAQACDVLKETWQQLWLSTNKAFGFEVVDVRLSGVKGRLQSCASRVEKYCNGTIENLEELEEDRLLILRKENTNILNGVYFWKQIVTSACAF